MPIYVALLRSMAIGDHRITGADVRKLAEDVGGTEAQSVLATGNLVFRSRKSPAVLTKELEAACAKRWGRATEVVVKSETQWRRLVAANPFKREADDAPNRVLLFAMRTPVTKQGIAQLERRATKTERIVRVGGGSFYIWFGNPDRDSTKIPPGFGLKALGGVGTNRTWTTVARITAALDEMK